VKDKAVSDAGRLHQDALPSDIRMAETSKPVSGETI
jgi:hypothetical protein